MKTREEVINYFNENLKAPSSTTDRPLYKVMMMYIKEGDEEIIALKEKFRDNTIAYGVARRMDGSEKRSVSVALTVEKKRSGRVNEIRKRHEETGLWPVPGSPDYKFIMNAKPTSSSVQKLWEDMHRAEEPRPVESVSTGIDETKTVSELTLSEISSFLKIIGNKTVAELIKESEKPKEPEKVDISKIETSLSEDTIRTIINPEKEVVVTNPRWEKAKELLEYIFADDSLKRHFAYETLLISPAFTREVSNFVMNNPKKPFYHKEKIVERMINFIPADRYFLLNPANIQDLVTNCF